jgi:hypothetical protein
MEPLTITAYLYAKVDISDNKFRLKVKMPRPVRRAKVALDKNVVREIIHLCEDIRIKTYVMTLAATGMGAGEDLSGCSPFLIPCFALMTVWT